MSQHYSIPEREADPHALPNVEVFYRTETANLADGWLDDDGQPYGEGWYAWYCLPGCMPDSEPEGPFATRDDAVDAMREDV